MKICILGASGMLGHMLFYELQRMGFDVYGTVRSSSSMIPPLQRIVAGVDATDFSSVLQALDALSPDVVINAIGLIRHLPEGRDPLCCIKINAEFPHKLLEACRKRNMRCIHYSTDCVFDGKLGRPYTEQDRPTASDIYGLTKFLGEIAGEGALTIRTSIIGPELRGKHSLVEWFLAQQGSVKGYTKAIYTGLPTNEHATILARHILPNPDIHGLYQVSAEPISKYDLLQLIAAVYGKKIDIIPDDVVSEDKRLSGAAFHTLTGYQAPSWEEMIPAMREAHLYVSTQNLKA